MLEHLSGGEMLRQLQRVKRYSEAAACALFKQVAAAVAYLHSLGILHRDIKVVGAESSTGGGPCACV